MVRVIDLARAIERARKTRQDISPDDDLLGLYLKSAPYDGNTTQFLLDMQRQRRLVLLLDGMDEAGVCRELLEAYVSCRLVTEVHLCLTARPQGIASIGLFEHFFEEVKIMDLDEAQQDRIITGRFKARPMEGAQDFDRISSFKAQISANPSFQGLCCVYLSVCC